MIEIREIQAEYDARTGKYGVHYNGEMKIFDRWEDFESYCKNNKVIPISIACYNTPILEVTGIRERREKLVEMIINSK